MKVLRFVFMAATILFCTTPKQSQARLMTVLTYHFRLQGRDTTFPAWAIPGQNRSSILQFRVVDVDREYLWPPDVVSHWVKGPTPRPWGTRSICFRDPDGNLVNFFAPASPAK